MNFRRDTKGFTLGELLTVVMIIGILVGVALPVYGNQIEKSREDNDISLVRAAYTECRFRPNWPSFSLTDGD